MHPRLAARPAVRLAFQRTVLAVSVVSLLASCESVPSPHLSRGRHAVVQSPAPGGGARTTVNGAVVQTPLEAEQQGPVPQIRRGTGRVINTEAASAPPPNLPMSGAGATFNFEGESVHAVVKAILGDMLGQNYVIAPGVQGTVTLATPKPVSPAEAMNLLEMVLGWNNLRMVYSGGRYNIVPGTQEALGGAVAPRTGPASTARGYEVRTIPLRYISATEMEKILKPYARPGSITNVDNARNIISVAGSRAELENYLRTVAIFDVDWLSGMSVAVYPLESARAARVVQDLERVFGENSKSPVAGMFRFMPLEGANSVMVITPQANYLDDVAQWIEKMDSVGAGVQLYTYELKYIKARELADRLAEVFGGGRSGGSDTGGAPSLMPGLNPTEITDGENGSSASIGGDKGGSSMGDTSGTGSSTGSGGIGSGSMSLNNAGSNNGSVTLDVDGARVGVSAVAENNALLVRSTPAAWKSIKNVIEKLDLMPMQVHIEAQVAEVQLSGALKYGVNWYFENAVSDPVTAGGAGLPNAAGRSIWGDIRGSNTGAAGLAWTFLGRNAAAVITALDQVTDLRILQTPSIFASNNTEATLNVGARIPISSVTVNPNTGTGSTTYSQVQYLDTGIILKVRPRVTRDGMVFLDIVQEVSSPGTVEDTNGNVRIDTRKVKTSVAVPDGDTVLLAGLINDTVDRGGSGLPGLSRIPVIGGLFGTQRSGTARNETIVLLTPRIVRNPNEMRDYTDEYSRRFRAMEPLHPKSR